MIDEIDGVSFGGTGRVIRGDNLRAEGGDVRGFFISKKAEASLGFCGLGSGGMGGS